jgi:hypothetical protein
MKERSPTGLMPTNDFPASIARRAGPGSSLPMLRVPSGFRIVVLTRIGLPSRNSNHVASALVSDLT